MQFSLVYGTLYMECTNTIFSGIEYEYWYVFTNTRKFQRIDTVHPSGTAYQRELLFQSPQQQEDCKNLPLSCSATGSYKNGFLTDKEVMTPPGFPANHGVEDRLWPAAQLSDCSGSISLWLLVVLQVRGRFFYNLPAVG